MAILTGQDCASATTSYVSSAQSVPAYFLNTRLAARSRRLLPQRGLRAASRGRADRAHRRVCWSPASFNLKQFKSGRCKCRVDGAAAWLHVRDLASCEELIG